MLGRTWKTLRNCVQCARSKRRAFAALKNDGSVIAWGDANNGGDTTDVAKQLKDSVRQIYATNGAFTALKADGSLVTWGNPDRGGQIT